MILSEAQQRCRDIVERIRPFCRQAEAAGDVRREIAEIDRLVIVAVPITHDGTSLIKLRELVNTYWGKPKEKFPTILTEIRAEPPHPVPLANPLHVWVDPLRADGAPPVCGTRPRALEAPYPWRLRPGGPDVSAR